MPLVLIVDDARDARRYYRNFLVERGYRVITAPDGETGVRRARRRLPDLIVMDLSMPGIDGIEASRLLRADPATRGIPIIAVSGYGTLVARLAAQAGFTAFLTKPCPSSDLLAAVDQVLFSASSSAQRA
jgi:two-component system cell cycle response regulator DivK